MRSVLLGAAVIVLSGCATVSMVPGEATVETGLSNDQTALHAASQAYCQQLESEGWVSASHGFANLASILMHGESNIEAGESYSNGFSDPSAAPSEQVADIAADVRTARLGLQAVSNEVRRVLDDETIETQRRDVTSFERALVHAQRASRAFAEALETVAERTTLTQAADTALVAFNAEIDEARRLADELAARYASLGDAAA